MVVLKLDVYVGIFLFLKIIIEKVCEMGVDIFSV